MPDYDVDREYNAMILEIAHERESRAIQSQTAWKDLLIGTNLVSHMLRSKHSE